MKGNQCGRVLLLTFCLLLMIGSGWNASVASSQTTSRFVLIEGDGTQIVLPQLPRRVVVLSWSTAEILAHLGIRPVGVPASLQVLPPQLQGIPEVGMAMRPDIEKIKNVRPDLVIASSQFKATLKPILVDHGMRSYFIDNQLYTDGLASITKLGLAFDRQEVAERLLAGIKKRERAVLARIAGRRPPRVLIIFGTSESFMLAREDSYVGDLVRTLRGVNVTTAMSSGGMFSGYVPFSLEKVVESNPEVILRIAHGNPETTTAIFQKEFASDPVWKRLEAIKRGRVYDLEAELFFANPGLKSIDALEKLAELLYGLPAKGLK